MATETTAPSIPKTAFKRPKDRTIIDKLFTREDTFNVHKIFGFSCLASFIYRFSQAGIKDGGFGPHPGTVVFIVLHLCLNLSSFIFYIPQRRIKSGDRIWPEYRIHSLAFAARSLACMLLLWCEQYFELGPLYLANLLIVLGTCALADWGSSIQGEHASSTIRDVQIPSYFPEKEIKFVFSAFQIHATTFCLIGAKRYTMHLVFVFIIQVTAFLLTLRRKNVGSNVIIGALYAIMLFTGQTVGLYDDRYGQELFMTGTVGHFAIILRLGPLHLNKYILWTSLGLGVHYVRSTGMLDVKNNSYWAASFLATFVLSVPVLMSYNRLMRYRKATKELHEKKA